MKISKSNSLTFSQPTPTPYRGPRKFTAEDIPVFIEKFFSEFDRDKNARFTKGQFSAVIQALISFVGGETPHPDDVQDIFNLLDINGDETIDRHEFQSIMVTFFKLLSEKNIDISIEKESDIII